MTKPILQLNITNPEALRALGEALAQYIQNNEEAIDIMNEEEAAKLKQLNDEAEKLSYHVDMVYISLAG